MSLNEKCATYSKKYVKIDKNEIWNACQTFGAFVYILLQYFAP